MIVTVRNFVEVQATRMRFKEVEQNFGWSVRSRTEHNGVGPFCAPAVHSNALAIDRNLEECFDSCQQKKARNDYVNKNDVITSTKCEADAVCPC